MATLTIEKLTDAGSDVSGLATAATAGGDEYSNDGATYLYLENTSGASVDITLHGQVECNQGHIHDNVVTVPAGSNVTVPPLPVGHYNDPNGYVQITYSAAAGVNVCAYKEDNSVK